MINIVLVEPEIPQNTGNISRTCAVTGMPLWLVRPLGFEISDRTLKRAGLDYWDKLDLHYEDSFAELRAKFPDRKFYFLSSKAKHGYHEVAFEDDCFLVFGKETKGLPEELLRENEETSLRIPMRGDARCLNLSNAVAVVAYEALRQIGFPEMR